ncbi:hypothetical protein JCM5350_003573 [Sporobolomyces pararoseus]
MGKEPKIPSSALESYNHDISKGPIPELVLKCYEKGTSGLDKLLTEDGETIMFFWKYHNKLSGWESEFREGGPEGTIICRVKKGLSSSFVLSLPDGKEAEGVTTGHSIAREFVSPFSGTRYKWKNVGIPGQGANLALVDVGVPEEKTIVAAWDAYSKLGSGKNGTLRINRDRLDDLEIICATALAMQAIEYSRQGGLV